VPRSSQRVRRARLGNASDWVPGPATFGSAHSDRLTFTPTTVRSLPSGLTVAQRREVRADAADSPPVRFVSSDPCRYRRYWLERFTLDEIHEMARWLPGEEP